MKNRGSLSTDRQIRRSIFPAGLTVILMVIAAAVLCGPPSMAADSTVRSTGQEHVAEPKSLQSADPDPEEPEHGLLILEDPSEMTRYAEYEMAVGDGFSISFIHSVNQSPVTDYFEIREDGIYGVKTVYYDFGAGVPTELEEGQTLTYGDDGSMIISGLSVKMNSLIYRVGTVYDHILTLEDGSEVNLRELCGQSARVGFRFEADSEESMADG